MFQHKYSNTFIEGALLVFTAGVLWSIGGALMKGTSLSSYQISFWRSFFAILTMVAVIKPLSFTLDKYTIISSVSYSIVIGGYAIATKMTSVANAIFLQYTFLIYIILISVFILKERVGKTDLFISAIICLGMGFLFIGKTSLEGWIGMIIASITAVANAIFIVMNKKRTQGHPVEPMFLGILIVMLISIVIVVLDSFGDPRGVTHKDVYFGFAVGEADSIVVAFLGIFQIGIPSLLFMKGAKMITPIETSLYSMIEPVLSPLWAILLIGEMVEWNTVVGGVIILFSLFIKSYIQYRKMLKKTL